VNSKKLLLFILLNINFAITPVFTLVSSSDESHKNQFNEYIQGKQNTQLMIAGACTAITGLIVASRYIQDKYYNDDLVGNKYEYAQAWYEAMSQKHPKAHLESKKILEAKTQFPIFNNIYFSHIYLKQINSIYKKQLEDQELTSEEASMLAQQEFILIFQAGFIDKNYGVYANMSAIASDIAILSLVVPALKTLHSTENISNFDSLLKEVDKFDFNYNVSIIPKIILLVTANAWIINCYDKAADEFACKECDIDCLYAAVEFFENNNMSKNRIEYIKNEIASREQN